jgi:outer membrane lipoprotein SlyB
MERSAGLRVLVGSVAMLLSLMTPAASNRQSGPGALTARARVNFRITIPKILYLRVGAGTAYPTTLGNLGTVNLLNFSPSASGLGNGTPVAGSGGDLTGGVQTAAIISNSGNVTLNATATGPLGDATGDSIPYTQISTAASALTAGYTLLAAPALTNATTANIVLTAPATKVIKADAKWTYSYANTISPPAGTYGGVNVHNSRVVYTASMP